MSVPEFEVVVRGGLVATAGDVVRADIGIADGRVVALGTDLGGAPTVIDAAGRIVTPGGVDAHCHLDQPMLPPARTADDFRTGTRSAACGGTTTVIPFAAQRKGESLLAAVADYHQRAAGKALVDYAFHLIVADPTPEALTIELPVLIADGITSFKVYLTYDDLRLDDRQVLEVLAVARREGALCMVHAENADAIGWLTARLEQAGHTEPRFHVQARPPVVEREAVHRAVALAELVGVPILLVHISGADAIEQIRWAHGRGLTVYGETCPQYLFLTADALDAGYEGAKLICSPPPRTTADQKAVWNGLVNGTFQVFSSDHAPFRYDDPGGKKPGGQEAPFPLIPNGLPGLETRLPLLMSEGVGTGRLTLEQFVALTSTNPAKLYGLYPRKGTLAAGSDADLVVWDTETERTITNSALHHAVDYTPYEGMTVRAWPALTLSRGEIIWDGHEPCGRPGRGRFLTCERPALARPRPPA